MSEFQRMFDAMSEADRQTRSRYHLTLGKLIKLLECIDPKTLVVFDTGGFPGGFHSYRGYYADLGLDESRTRCTAKSFAVKCRQSLGQTFRGYKGGDFEMGEETPLWRASYGNCGSAIVDAQIQANKLVLITKNVD